LSAESAASRRWRETLLADPGTLAAGVIGAIIAGVIFVGAIRNHLASDYPADLAFTAHGLKTGVFPGDLLFQVLNGAFAGFSTDARVLKASLVLVLAVATGVKIWFSARFVVTEDAAASGSRANGITLAVVVTAAGFCTLAFCLPGQNYYLGEIPPNVWHNPSTILLMPFAVGLFWSSLLFLRSGDVKYIRMSLVLGVLNVLAKPSFVLCFLLVFPVVAFLRFGWSRETRLALFLTVLIACVLGVQYIYVYAAAPPGSSDTSTSGVTIAPFRVWNAYTSQIPRALIDSYLFPAAALILGGTAVWRNRGVQYALALAMVGLVEYALLAEGGARLLDGNFTWQAVITQYILFLTLVAALVPWLRAGRWRIRKALIATAFAAHLWAGGNYLGHWFATKSFT
jgi:hypothetical protein